MLIAATGAETYPADDLSAPLHVDTWRHPGQVDEIRKPAEADDIDGIPAPSWWRGDEDASQAFMTSMGVMP